MPFLPFIALQVTLATPGMVGYQAAPAWQGPFVSWEQVNQVYDPAKERTLSASIRQVHLTRLMGKDPASYLILEDGTPGTVVLVGPVSFLDTKRFILGRGLAVVCTGSLVNLKGQKILISREIKVGGRKLTLRDRGGKALWKSNGSRHAPAAKPK